MRAARGSGAEHGEVIIVRAYALIRLVAMLQAAVAAAASYPHHRPLAAGAGLIAALVAQSAALITVAFIRRQMPPRWLIGLEAGVMAGELAAGAAISAPGYGDTWAYFVYPFSVIAIIGVGLSFRRLPAVLAVSAVPAAVYAAVNVAQMGETPWNAALDAMAYLLNSSVAWLVAGALRRSSHRLDVAHGILTGREVELAGERERARHVRMLHDRVLQILEVLAHGDFVADPALRGHVRAEATWLRSFVRGEPHAMTDLPGALAAVAEEMARSGLAVQLNTAQLADALRRRGQPSTETTQALADAAREALVNVLKHSGARTAVLHAELTARTLTVSVLDRGCGFDDQVQEAGFGLTSSIRARIAAIGGEVSVESQPDMGTYVELRVPVPAYLVAPKLRRGWPVGAGHADRAHTVVVPATTPLSH
jgi:signal transduction histidine kinase